VVGLDRRGRFDVVMAGDDVPRKKPDPIIYQVPPLALSPCLLALSPCCCHMIHVSSGTPPHQLSLVCLSCDCLSCVCLSCVCLLCVCLLCVCLSCVCLSCLSCVCLCHIIHVSCCVSVFARSSVCAVLQSHIPCHSPIHTHPNTRIQRNVVGYADTPAHPYWEGGGRWHRSKWVWRRKTVW